MAKLAKRLIPLLDRILVQKVAPPTTTIGGIVLPDAARKALNQGLVLAVGPGYRGKDGKLVPPSVNVGDKVLLPNFGGNEIHINDEEFHLYRDEEILAKILDK